MVDLLACMWVVDEETGLRYPVIAGGDDTDGVEGGEGLDGGEPGGEPEGDRDPGDTGGKPKVIPYERFQEVIRQNQEYRQLVETYGKLGKPEEIQKNLARLNELAKSVKNPDDEAKVRAELLKYLPELNELRAMRQAQAENYVTQGQERVNKYLKEVGLKVDEENNHILQETLAGVIARDKNLLKRFVAADPSVYDDAWKRIKTNWFAGRRAIPGADVVTKKAGQPVVNGKPAVKGGKPDHEKTDRERLDEAHEEAWSRLQAVEE